MATEYLGPQIDIHGGGADLIFPHHACEIAQAEPVTGVAPFVRCWMHTGLVALGGTKMSKSLGNMVFVEEVLERHSAAALRLAILNYVYREPFEYSWQAVAHAERQAQTLAEARAAASGTGDTLNSDAQFTRFLAALDNDFNTPTAITVAVELAEQIITAGKAGGDISSAQQVLREMCDVLGVVPADQ